MSRSLAARLCAALATVAASAALVAGVAVGGEVAGAAAPKAPVSLPRSIEPLAPYQEQVSCDPRAKPGAVRLGRLLSATYRASGGFSVATPCGSSIEHSEHYDGRAVDWMVNYRNLSQRAAAKAVLSWLFARDAAGNTSAMARRLGVMYVIFDGRMWGSWSGTWEDYNGCTRSKAMKARAYDNACHRDHMHISLDWNGAMGTTSFWTGRVWAINYGPCRPDDLNWAPRYRARNTTGCPDHGTVRAPAKASAVKRGLVRYSGAEVMRGSTGPVVSALQAGLRIPTTGVYDGRTVAAVRALQSRHHLPVGGTMGPRTWRVLLAAVR
ncbi:peptidoglycan-binding domain-containing protein [Jatrophihabitans fulvus]